MSWFSRAGGSWSAGRFSPFGRQSNPNGGSEVTDGDFSYITSEDLANATSSKAASSGETGGRNRAHSRPAEIVDWDDKDPERDTDVLVFKSGRTNYPVHFPAQSIRDGELSIGAVRAAAAKKIGVSDPKRIRLFFRGKNLKFDERTAREEGLRGDGSGSEILCVIGSEAGSGRDGPAPGAEDVGIPGNAQRSWSDDDDEDDTEEAGTDGGISSRKKPRKRGGRKSKKKNPAAYASGTSTPGAGYSNASPSFGAEFLPIPSHISAGGPPRPTSAPPPSHNIPRAATPQTPIDKLDVIASKFHTELVPLCVQYIQNPPKEKKEREFEYKKLSETILAQVLLKVDGVETEGDEGARARRKGLVKEVQGMLGRLDEVVKA